MDKEKLWCWAPVAAAIVLAVLWVRPCRRLPADDETKARANIVPLNVRDPTALIFASASERAR